MVGVIGGRRAAAAAAAVAVIAGVVPFVGRAGAASAGVEIRGSAFLPSEVHVGVGDSVTWTNFDADRHTVQGGPMASPEFAQGGSFTFTFGEAGVFNYICRLHTFMTGSVVVDGAGAAPAPPPLPRRRAPTPCSRPARRRRHRPRRRPRRSHRAAAAAASPAAGGGRRPATPVARPRPRRRPAPRGRGRAHHHPDRGPSGGRRHQPDGHHHRPPRRPSPPPPSHPTSKSLESAGQPLGDGTTLAPFRTVGDVKVFDLDMVEVMQEVEPGVVKPAYAFNGVIPGPVLRVDEGDKVRMVVKNDLPFDTGVHWHGMVLPNDQDGVPGITQPAIMPGETYTYEFTAVATGTHWYHTHSSGRHIGKGLYGMFEVVPEEG